MENMKEKWYIIYPFQASKNSTELGNYTFYIGQDYDNGIFNS